MAPSERELPLHVRLLHAAALYAGVLTIYFAAGHAARPPVVRLSTPLDDALPFMPVAMAGYALAYLMPLSLAFIEVTEAGVRRMTRAVLLAYLLAAPFFLAMPVVDADPPLQAESGSEHLLVLNRGIDTTKNAFPSMHVGLAALLALVAWRRSRAWGLALAGAAALIAASTLLVKQHFIADIPAGLAVAVAAHAAVYRGGDEAGS